MWFIKKRNKVKPIESRYEYRRRILLHNINRLEQIVMRNYQDIPELIRQYNYYHMRFYGIR